MGGDTAPGKVIPTVTAAPAGIDGKMVSLKNKFVDCTEHRDLPTKRQVARGSLCHRTHMIIEALTVLQTNTRESDAPKKMNLLLDIAHYISLFDVIKGSLVVGILDEESCAKILDNHGVMNQFIVDLDSGVVRIENKLNTKVLHLITPKFEAKLAEWLLANPLPTPVEEPKEVIRYDQVEVHLVSEDPLVTRLNGTFSMELGNDGFVLYRKQEPESDDTESIIIKYDIERQRWCIYQGSKELGRILLPNYEFCPLHEITSTQQWEIFHPVENHLPLESVTFNDVTSQSDEVIAAFETMKTQTISTLWKQAKNHALKVTEPNWWIMNKINDVQHKFFVTEHAEKRMNDRGVTSSVLSNARIAATADNLAVYYDFSGYEERCIQGRIIRHTADKRLVVQLEDGERYAFLERLLLFGSDDSRTRSLRRIDEALQPKTTMSEQDKAAALDIRLCFSDIEEYRNAKFFGAVLEKHWGANKCEICHKMIVFTSNSKQIPQHGDLVIIVTASMRELVTAYFVDFNHPQCHPVLKVKEPATTACRSTNFKPAKNSQIK